MQENLCTVHDCYHPSVTTVIDDYLGQRPVSKQLCCEKNKNNDCPHFESIISQNTDINTPGNGVISGWLSRKTMYVLAVVVAFILGWISRIMLD